MPRSGFDGGCADCYIPAVGVGEGELVKQVFDYVTSDRPVEWMRMPEVYERFMYPGMTVEASSDPRQFEKTLADAFPKEKRGLHRYCPQVRLFIGGGGG